MGIRNNILLGILVSLVISASILLLRFSVGRPGDIIYTSALSTFVLSLMIWLAHTALGYNRWYHERVKSLWIEAPLSIIIAAVVIFILFDAINVDKRGDVFLSSRRALKGEFRDVFFVTRLGLLSTTHYMILLFQRTREQRRINEIEAERIKQLYLEAKLSSLGEQLSPHFMFNALNTLSSMLTEVPAQKFIKELAYIYRYLLEHKQEKLTTLAKELSFMHSYLHIQKERFGEALAIEIKVADGMMGSKIPPIVLQLLLENAIKHNVVSRSKPLMVKIYDKDGFLVVENNYQPKRDINPSSKKGLINIAERYKLLFEKEIEIEMNDDFFRVKLPLLY